MEAPASSREDPRVLPPILRRPGLVPPLEYPRPHSKDRVVGSSPPVGLDEGRSSDLPKPIPPPKVSRFSNPQKGIREFPGPILGGGGAKFTLNCPIGASLWITSRRGFPMGT